MQHALQDVASDSACNAYTLHSAGLCRKKVHSANLASGVTLSSLLAREDTHRCAREDKEIAPLPFFCQKKRIILLPQSSLIMGVFLTGSCASFAASICAHVRNRALSLSPFPWSWFARCIMYDIGCGQGVLKLILHGAYSDMLQLLIIRRKCIHTLAVRCFLEKKRANLKTNFFPVFY